MIFSEICILFTSSVQERDQGRCERGEDGPGEPGKYLRLRGEAPEERGEGGHPGQQRRRHDVSPEQDRGRLRDADRNKSFWPLLSHQPSSANDYKGSFIASCIEITQSIVGTNLIISLNFHTGTDF